MATNYADFSYRDASLASDFGAEFAAKYFDAETLAKVPVYVRGPKKGKMKGSVEWTRCTRGGWVRGGNGYGFDDGPKGYVESRVNAIISVSLVGPGVYCNGGMSQGKIIATVCDRVEKRAEELAQINAARIAEIECELSQLLDAYLYAEYSVGCLTLIGLFRADMAVRRAELQHLLG